MKLNGCDEFGGALSLNIHNAIINVWSFIIMFTYKSKIIVWTVGLFQVE
jgi:hypothetical protein